MRTSYEYFVAPTVTLASSASIDAGASISAASAGFCASSSAFISSYDLPSRHLSSLHPRKWQVKLTGSRPCRMTMKVTSSSVRPVTSLASPTYFLASSMASLRSLSLAPLPIHTKISRHVSSNMTSSSMRSAWSKSKISSAQKYPRASEHWNRRGSASGMSSTSTFAYEVGPSSGVVPSAAQKAGGSVPSVINSGSWFLDWKFMPGDLRILCVKSRSSPEHPFPSQR
mmetsp:Transcript_89681/g.124585  ORF Transcript_89681/g.124585 Transcript_89681/m.124585 type:complete len:227 (-) Transcript_89681:1194-1874(-)